MSKKKRVEIKQGILNAGTGSTDVVQVSKNGVIQISKENRNITKKKK